MCLCQQIIMVDAAAALFLLYLQGHYGIRPSLWLLSERLDRFRFGTQSEGFLFPFLSRKGKMSFHGYFYGIIARPSSLLIMTPCARMTSPWETKIGGL